MKIYSNSIYYVLKYLINNNEYHLEIIFNLKQKINRNLSKNLIILTIYNIIIN